MSTVDSGAKCWLLSFREGRWELSQYARFEREPCEFRHGRHAQFGRNALAVVFDRALRDAEIIGNLLIQPSADHMTEHLALALAQSPNSLVCFPPLRSCFAFACVRGHRAPDGIEERHLGRRLDQEMLGATAHRPPARGEGSMPAENKNG